MSADPEGDSHMFSSPSDSEQDTITNASVLQSPPDSQHRQPLPPTSTTSTTMPTSTSGASLANSNGKRPIQTISNGADGDAEELAAMANGKARGHDFPIKTHQPSGYSWTRVEEEPGYAWMNKKALDEHQRAFEALVHKDCVVKNRFGDPFEAAEKEQAVLNSLKQR